MPPPLPPKKELYPQWALQTGIKPKEDSGGKYYEFEYVVRQKMYVYPVIRVEHVSGYVKKPFGYKNKTDSRKQNAVSVTDLKNNTQPVTEEPVKTKAKIEEW
jgi:hypothetical protein